MGKLTATEITAILMAPLTKATGSRIVSTGMVWKPGLMALFIKVHTSQVRSMESVASLFGQTIPNMKDNSETITSRALALTPGQMVVATQANGKTTRCTERAFLLGRIPERSIAENTETIKSMAMERLAGPMAGSMLVSGLTESSMAQALTLTLEVRPFKVSGSTVSVLNDIQSLLTH